MKLGECPICLSLKVVTPGWHTISDLIFYSGPYAQHLKVIQLNFDWKMSNLLEESLIHLLKGMTEKLC